ncbi:unnamed protein product [Arabidopsis halleri]
MKNENVCKVPHSAIAPLAVSDLVFEPLIDLNGWCYRLRQYLDSLGRPKRLLVFVNPFGGKKSAREIFVKEVKPLFEDANIEVEIQGS